MKPENTINNLNASVIITNYNGKDLLEKNLPFILIAKNKRENRIGEIIVVDDASKDESVDFIKNNFPDIRVIRHTRNRGFIASTNTGARSAKYPLLVLLNSDVVVSDDFLVSVIQLFKDRSIFAVSMHEQGFGNALGEFKNGFFIHSSGKETNQVKNTLWVSGGSGIFRREYWMRLGGMDEKLYSPFYWEDVDLGYRALKRGYRLVWDPDSKVTHEHESTMKKISNNYRNLIQQRNNLIFIWKNITSPSLIKKHIVALFTRITKHPGYLIVSIMALIKIGKILKSRRKEKKECKVSDEAILAEN